LLNAYTAYLTPGSKWIGYTHIQSCTDQNLSNLDLKLLTDSTEYDSALSGKLFRILCAPFVRCVASCHITFANLGHNDESHCECANAEKNLFFEKKIVFSRLFIFKVF